MRAQLRTLGAFELRIDGRAVARPSTQKARALLAYLCLRQGSAIARDEIVEQFWPESEPDNARQSLKTALWSIRRVVRDGGADPDEFLEADRFTVRWIAPTRVDAREFEERAAAGDLHAPNAYHGDFLPGDYDEWTAAQREALIRALESLLSKAVEIGEDVGAAQRLLQIDPFSEPAYAVLIDSELRGGRRLAAQTVLQRYREVLRQNGMHPSAAFESRFAALDVAETAVSGAPRFAGRSGELAAFESRLQANVSAAFVVHADAGFGKTALLDEFRRRVVGDGRSMLSLSASPELSGLGGFGGWETLYRDRTGKTLERLAATRGTGLPSALAAEIAETIEPGSYVFVDDAHYLHGDAAFVTAAVVRASRERSASVVVATRPEGIRAVLSWFEADVVELPLEGLSEDEIRAVLPQRGGEGERLAHALFERTAGHPLFVARVLERIAGGYGAIEMPQSVRALIDERLRARGEDAHTIAGLLAIDPRFDSDELAGVLQWPEERVLDAIDDLLALGIVVESESAAHLRFSHDVVMEVARDSLGVHRRKRFHRLAASVLNDATTLADMERAAEHNAAAAEPLAAADLFARCGEAARVAFEPRNAMAFARRALDELERVESTAQSDGVWLAANSVLIRASIATSDVAGAERIASACIAAAQKREDRKALFDMVLLRMRARIRRLSLEEIESDARWALRLARELDDPARVCEAFDGLQFVAEHRNDKAAARTCCLAGLDAALASGDPELTLYQSAEAFRILCQFRMMDDAVDAWKKGQTALRSAPGSAEPSFRFSASQLLEKLERLAEAEEEARLGLMRAESERPAPYVSRYFPDKPLAKLLLTYQLGFLTFAQGRVDEAWRYARAMRENPASLQPFVAVVLADLDVRLLLERNAQGDVERAKRILAAIDPTSVADNNRNILACMRARIEVRAGDPSAASTLRQAFEAVSAMAESTDAEQHFKDIAAAARELGDEVLACRARELWQSCRRRRQRDAGVHWGDGSSEAV